MKIATPVATVRGRNGVWVFALGYGMFRLDEGKRTITPGTRVALIQTDGPTNLPTALLTPQELSAEAMATTNAAIADGRARNEPPPALIICPESPGFPPLTREFLTASPTEAQLKTWGMTPADFAGFRASVPFFARSVRDIGGASFLYGVLEDGNPRVAFLNCDAKASQTFQPESGQAPRNQTQEFIRPLA